MDGVRELAQRRHKRMSDVVNELLAEGLRREREAQRVPLTLKSFHMGRCRVNLGDRNALEALMDS